MKTSPISTLAVSLALRNSTSRMQETLPRLQQEMVTGKYADSGLALGSESRKLISFLGDVDHTGRLMDTNAQVQTRLTMTQESMSRINTLASNLMNAVGIVMGDNNQYPTAQQTAKNVVAETSSILNTQINGTFLFGGVNTDNQPIADYDTGGGKAAFDAAFLGYFGFDKNDPAAANVTRTDIENFLETAVKPLFLGAGWTANMSSATDEVIKSRISPEVTADTSVSANEKPFRELMMASVVATELFDSNLGGEAKEGVSNFVISQSGSATGGMTKLQGQTGLVEERLKRANDALSAQKSLLETFASDLESVDPYQTSIELNTLLTQIEVSYSITSRIQNLSIMDYL
jgi:flagellar hook-associated protein 3 FlgL